MRYLVPILLVMGLLMPRALGQTWVHDADDFASQGTRDGVVISVEEPELVLDPDVAADPATSVRRGVYLSPVFLAEEAGALGFFGYVADPPGPRGGITPVKVELRASEAGFDPDEPTPPWTVVANGQLTKLPRGRFFQYRITLTSNKPEITPRVREVTFSTRTVGDMMGDTPRPRLEDLLSTMVYTATPYKLHSLYSLVTNEQGRRYNASERGAYILRNDRNTPIDSATWEYRPEGGLENYLAARFGSWIIVRFHPYAGFNDLTLRPADNVQMDKYGGIRPAERSQSHSINFFDEAFMSEYLTGVGAAVDYYKRHNPRVLGYNIAPPEFYYDAVPWPQMSHASGFSPEAFASYQAFMADLGIAVEGWPTMSDGSASADRDYYLWVYWRHWAAANYIARVARTIKEHDPEAEVGTLSYTGDLHLRGMEAAFLEINPDITFYYSSNMFPRVPGPDGLTGGETFTLTRQNVLGHSKKLNLAEFDLWSPYVDLKRAEAYARYAHLQGILPIPFFIGDYPKGNVPSNHLTKYHGVTGESITPEIMATLANLTEDNRYLRETENANEVAVVYPSFSLYAILQKGRWMTDRNIQLSRRLFGDLIRMGVGFDLVSEGQVTAELLDRYKLVIVHEPAAYPWMRAALEETRAHVLAIGWAGTVTAPGPRRLALEQDPADFDLSVATAWPADDGTDAAATTVFPTGGRAVRRAATFRFAEGDAVHPLVEGLAGKTVDFRTPGPDGRPPAYVRGLTGRVLATDDTGSPVYALETQPLADGAPKHTIHFGGLLDFANAISEGVSLFSPDDRQRWIGNVLSFCGVRYYDDLGPLRVFRTSRYTLIENTAEEPYTGPMPTPAGRPPAEDTLSIPAYGTVILPTQD